MRSEIKFTIDASIIERLGLELVSKQETAVSELIKNAYDADATKVIVKFINTDSEGGTLIIQDNGTGMTIDEFNDGFMRIASMQKIINPRSEIYNRLRAGKKGIGRFSTHRLGKELVVLTKSTKALSKGFKATIDWDSYSKGSELTDIGAIVEFDDNLQTGTTLIINNLREKWSDAQIRKVYKAVSELIQPHPLSKTGESFQNKLVDPGFKTSCIKEVNGISTIIADNDKFTYEFAVAKIIGMVDNKGFGSILIESERYGISEEIKIGKLKDKPNIPYEVLKDITFECHYFLFDSVHIPGQQLSTIKSIAKEHGGIRIYKNGFRIPPFGESNNDWIGLNESVSKRIILPPHSNSNFVGFVELYDLDDSIIFETANREGLVSNHFFQELSDFMFSALTRTAVKIAEIRNRKQTAGQRNWITKEKSSNEIIDDIIRDIDNFKVSGESQPKEKAETFITSTREKLQLVQAKITEELDKTSMLRVLASLGLSIGQFTHEIRHNFLGIEHAISNTINSLKDDADIKRLKDVANFFNSTKMYTSYFDKTISENVNRELAPQDVGVRVNKFYMQIKDTLAKSNIVFVQPEIIGYNHMTVPMHESEWASILINFYTNSIKAIKRANQNNGKISIMVTKDEKYIHLYFYDNGDGIPLADRDKIFDAFFTTSNIERKSFDEHEVLGTGLGLSIVKDIVTSYGGKLEVTDAPAGYTTSIHIIFPKKQ